MIEGVFTEQAIRGTLNRHEAHALALESQRPQHRHWRNDRDFAAGGIECHMPRTVSGTAVPVIHDQVDLPGARWTELWRRR